MKKIWFVLASVYTLTACGSESTPLAMAPVANPILKTQSASQDTRIMETFKGYLGAPGQGLSNLPVAEMLMSVKSLLGSTYDNKNSATRYRLFFTNQKDDLSFVSGPVRLGKDGILYLEYKHFNQGQTNLEYYRLGTFAPLGDQVPTGTEVKFQLDKGNSLKMKWRGWNPMNHEEIHFFVQPSVKPQTLPLTALR